MEVKKLSLSLRKKIISINNISNILISSKKNKLNNSKKKTRSRNKNENII